MPATQDNREFAVTCPLGKDVLLFKSMKGVEGLGELFEYSLVLLSEKSDIAIDSLLGKTMTVSVELEDESYRYLNGYVTRFAFTGHDGCFATYEATLSPSLWFLTRSVDCRIFQEKSVVDIIKPILATYNVVVDDKLQGSYPALPYCVQYRETDFNFVSRLMEHAGIYYYFKHDANAHTLVLADAYGAHEAIEGDTKIPYYIPSAAHDKRGIHDWSMAGSVRTGTYTLNDFDFEKVSSSLSGGLMSKSTVARQYKHATYEMYDYPGLYTVRGDGDALSLTRIQAVQAQYQEISAHTTAREIASGSLFTLADHPREDQNGEHLVVSAKYILTAPDYDSNSSSGSEFYCGFTALSKAETYRPLQIMPKPHVHGPQTAVVVGKSGEEIWTDKYGRIKVQFHWDRLGKTDENSSCWVRVSQKLAGQQWGAIFIPRIGQEVIVEFLEGDPDRPIVTGCVYNGDNMPPYALPENQSQSGYKSNSTKGGGGSNELRFEDKKGGEEIYFHAEKDFNRVVDNNDTLKVGFAKADKGDQAISINHDQSVDIGNDQTLHVKHDQTETVDNDQKVTVSNDQKVAVGNTCVIEAQTSIELKVGGSSIKIEPAKITIKSTQIAIDADATIEIKGGAPVTIKGAIVQIN